MRLLILSTVPITLRNFLCPFGTYYRGKGWRVDAGAAGADKDPFPREYFDQVWDVPWSRSLFSPSNYTHACGALREIVSRNLYDIVHVHSQ